MRLRYSLVAVASVAVAVLVGWGIGSLHSGCEYTCPANGPCPVPPGCADAFNWTAALVFGAVVAAVVAAVAGVVLFVRSDDF